MQINNSFSKSTTFGMALKITPKAHKALEQTSLEVLDKLQKAGEALKDTKYCHLEIGEKLRPRIDFPYASSYIAPFQPVKPKPSDSILEIKTTWDGTDVAGIRKGQSYKAYLLFDNPEQAAEAYAKINALDSDLDRAVELTKMFDNKEIKDEADRAAKRELDAKIKTAALDLIKKFGADAHEKP